MHQYLKSSTSSQEMLSTNWKAWAWGNSWSEIASITRENHNKGSWKMSRKYSAEKLMNSMLQKLQFTRGKGLQMLLQNRSMSEMQLSTSQTKWHSNPVQKITDFSSRKQFWEVVKRSHETHLDASKKIIAGSKMPSRKQLWTEFVDKRQWVSILIKAGI